MATATDKILEINDLLENYLNEDEKQEIYQILSSNMPIWIPQDGPQTEAFNSPADILYYGGQAGGGKTDLLLGLSLTNHNRSKIYRREGTQNTAMIDRLLYEILKSRDGWNGKDTVLKKDIGGKHRHIEFGACKDPGSELKDQGKKFDFKGFDEITHFLESQFRFLCGWNRGGRRNRIVCTGNPPTNEEGRWIIDYWGPWLDPSHPNPAKPGELRWYSTIDGQDQEFLDGSPFKYKGKTLIPKSRTFIPSGVRDNVFMIVDDYESTLAAMPEPLRSQMLEGNFFAGVEDSAWQLFPTEWVDQSMALWTPDGKVGEMSSSGADIARGGSAETAISNRYGNWYDELTIFPGQATPDGQHSAGLIISAIRDGAPVHVDIIGVGGSTYDHLKSNEIQVIGIDGRNSPSLGASDKTGRLKFKNKRSELHWKFREALDPYNPNRIILPNDPKLKTQLLSIQWFLGPSGIQVESKEQMQSGPRLHKGAMPLGSGFNFDRSDAVIYCSVDTIKNKVIRRMEIDNRQTEYNPLTFGMQRDENPYIQGM